MGLKEIVFPIQHDRPYGLASASFLLLVVFAQIEGMVFTAVGLILGRSDLFMELQVAIAPAAFLVAFAAAFGVYLQHRAFRKRLTRYTSELSAQADLAGFAERIGSRRAAQPGTEEFEALGRSQQQTPNS